MRFASMKLQHEPDYSLAKHKFGKFIEIRKHVFKGQKACFSISIEVQIQIPRPGLLPKNHAMLRGCSPVEPSGKPISLWWSMT